MPYITTEWDYGLKTEVFVVKGDKGYTHTTDTLLNEVGARDSSIIEYFTATFEVNVLRDIRDSKVVIYDDGEAIPVYIDGNPVQMLDWQQGNQSETFALKLGYDVEHKIYAKYLGNNKGLPSKSQILTISEPLPNLYGTLIERTTTASQFEANTAINIPIRFTTNRTFEDSEIKTISIYADGSLKSSKEVTLPAGQTTATTTFTLPDGLTNGIHQIEIRFEGDNHNEAFNLPFRISVGYKVEFIDYSPLIAATPTAIEDYNYVQCKITDYLNVPQENAAVTLQGSDNTVYATTTTDTDGIATFNQIATLPETFKAVYGNNQSETLSLPVIKVLDFRFGAEKVIAIGHSANAQITILEYQWLYNRKNNLEGIPVLFSDNLGNENKYYTNGEGVVLVPYVGANKGTVTLSADIGYSQTKYNTIEDITQYWSAETGILNKNYRILSTNFYELSSAFKFEVRAANSLSLIGFGDGEEYTDNWTVSFKVVSASPDIRLVAGDWYNSTNETWENLLMSNPISLKSGQTVTITYTTTHHDDGLITMQLPNDSISYGGNSKGNPVIGIISDTAKAQLSVDKIKFRQVK